jgi:hypothetical protein
VQSASIEAPVSQPGEAQAPKKKKKKKSKKKKKALLPESSFNVEAANFVPSGIIIPSEVKVTSTEKTVEKEEKK